MSNEETGKYQKDELTQMLIRATEHEVILIAGCKHSYVVYFIKHVGLYYS